MAVFNCLSGVLETCTGPRQTWLSRAGTHHEQSELDIGNVCSSVNTSPRMAHWLKARHMALSFRPLSLSPLSVITAQNHAPRPYPSHDLENVLKKKKITPVSPPVIWA